MLRVDAIWGLQGQALANIHGNRLTESRDWVCTVVARFNATYCTVPCLAACMRRDSWAWGQYVITRCENIGNIDHSRSVDLPEIQKTCQVWKVCFFSWSGPWTAPGAERVTLCFTVTVLFWYSQIWCHFSQGLNKKRRYITSLSVVVVE